MLVVSMIANLVVLVPLCAALLRDSPSMEQVYGTKSPARGILTAIYITFAFASIAVLASLGTPEIALGMAVPLLGAQVLYKVITWPLVGLGNVVTRFNLAIAVLHTVTLATIL